MSRRRGAGRNSLHDSRRADATWPGGGAGDSMAGDGLVRDSGAAARPPAATSGGGPSWRRWAILVSLAVAAAAAILLVATTPSREEPLPGDGVEAADSQVARLYDRAREGVRAKPSSAEAWGELGLVLAAHGHATNAVECFARAAVLAAADWRWPCFRAAVESDVDLDRAVETIAEAIRRDPRQEWPRLFRARWLEQLGRAAEAEPIYRTTIYFHVSPPNQRSCMFPPGRIMTTAKSSHAGGVNLAMCDASVRFVANAVDVGVWRAIGSRNQGESIADPSVR